jgi:membrane AbrB-like protein
MMARVPISTNRARAALPALLLLTAALVGVLYAIGLPAAFLLGAMGAAMIIVGRGATLRIPELLFALAQGVVGCLIARSFTLALLHTIAQRLGLFAGITLSVLVIATALGLLLARLRLLPGTTALWGSFPGAATVMVLLSGSFGGDMRLVAVMQYLRVVVVAVTASVVARLFGLSGTAAHHTPWLAPIAWPSFAVLLAIIVLGALLGPRLRVPAAPLLVPMVVATVLGDAGLVRVDLPQPLLVASYVVVGWAVGLRFTRESFRDAGRALPQILGAIVALVASCAGIGWVLARVAGIDPLTAYFATSPGGADSIAIIAAGTAVDIPFVMATQIGRFLTVLLLGPTLARNAAKLAHSTPLPQGEPHEPLDRPEDRRPARDGLPDRRRRDGADRE